MQRSALIREELEDAVAGLSPAARAVFEDIESRDEDAEPEFPEDFDALTPIERTSVTTAAEHLKGLAEAEAAEDPAADQTPSKGVSRRRRQLWIGSVIISLACLIAVGGILGAYVGKKYLPAGVLKIILTALLIIASILIVTGKK